MSISAITFVARLFGLPVAFASDPFAPLVVFGLCRRAGLIRDPYLLQPSFDGFAGDGFLALVLVLYVGLVDRPGQPSGQISLRIGWYMAVLGCLLMIFGGALRASGTERPRKPPGVL